MLLKKFSGFNKFIRLNHIDEQAVQRAAEFLEIREVNKGEYFLHEGEPSKFFAGLIKGKISFRKSKIINIETNEIVLKHLYKFSLLRKPTIRKKETKNLTIANSKIPNNNENEENNQDSNNRFKKIMNYINMNKSEKKSQIKSHHRFSVMQNYSTLKSQISLIKNKYSSKQEYKIIKEHFDPKKYIINEEELFQAGPGYCFGEWALIYNQPRSASVVTLEDCIFFTLDEKFFTKTFLKCLNNSEHRKKKFILDNLFPFDLHNERQNSIYKNIIPINCERNQIVFKEGDNADTIYVVYFGTFILEKKYKHKRFKMLSLEKGSIIGLESIFEEEEKNRKYKCSLRLTSSDEIGLIFSCNVNKLLPYIINKMKECFKNNYSLFIKTSEEFYLNNINIQRKMFFKKRGEKKEEFKEQKNNNNLNINNNIKIKKYLNLKKINEDEKNTLLNDLKKINRIKFKKSTQIKMDSIPFLKTIDNNSKLKNSEKFDRLKKRAKTIFKKNLTLKLNNQENKIPFINKRNIKRMNTSFSFNLKIKNKLNFINENFENKDEDIINFNKENNKNEEKKYIEGYKDKKGNGLKNQINEINELLDINNADSISEKLDKITNQISTLEISNNNHKLSKDNSSKNKSSYQTIKSSFKLIPEIEGKNSDFNTINNSNSNIKNKINQIKKKFEKYKKNKLDKDIFYKKEKEKENNFDYNLFIKINEECTLNLSPIKNKNKFKIENYVKYLLSYKNEDNLSNLEPNIKEKNTIKSEEKTKYKIKNIFNKYKSVKKIIKSRNNNNNDGNYFGFKTINNSELSYSKSKLFNFNSGAYKLPLLTQIINTNNKD